MQLVGSVFIAIFNIYTAIQDFSSQASLSLIRSLALIGETNEVMRIMSCNDGGESADPLMGAAMYHVTA